MPKPKQVPNPNVVWLEEDHWPKDDTLKVSGFTDAGRAMYRVYHSAQYASECNSTDITLVIINCLKTWSCDHPGISPYFYVHMKDTLAIANFSRVLLSLPPRRTRVQAFRDYFKANPLMAAITLMKWPFLFSSSKSVRKWMALYLKKLPDKKVLGPFDTILCNECGEKVPLTSFIAPKADLGVQLATEYCLICFQCKKCHVTYACPACGLSDCNLSGKPFCKRCDKCRNCCTCYKCSTCSRSFASRASSGHCGHCGGCHECCHCINAEVSATLNSRKHHGNSVNSIINLTASYYVLHDIVGRVLMADNETMPLEVKKDYLKRLEDVQGPLTDTMARLLWDHIVLATFGEYRYCVSSRGALIGERPSDSDLIPLEILSVVQQTTTREGMYNLAREHDPSELLKITFLAFAVPYWGSLPSCGGPSWAKISLAGIMREEYTATEFVELATTLFHNGTAVVAKPTCLFFLHSLGKYLALLNRKYHGSLLDHQFPTLVITDEVKALLDEAVEWKIVQRGFKTIQLNSMPYQSITWGMKKLTMPPFLQEKLEPTRFKQIRTEIREMKSLRHFITDRFN